MSLPAPNLDDRRFADLVEEAKERIQQRCPQWTDFNPSDPGIMLVELMAWMTETALYRLNRVPEKHYVKFLELMGVTLTPPQPAKCCVVFGLSEGAPEAHVGVVPIGTSVFSRTEEGETHPFSTTDRLNLTTAKILKIISRLQDRHEDHMKSFDENKLNDPPITFGEKGVSIFEGVEPLDHHLYLGDVNIGKYSEKARLIIQVNVTRPLEAGPYLEWEIEENTHWVPIVPVIDETMGLSQNGRIIFDPIPPIEETIIEEKKAYWLRARLIGLRSSHSPSLNSVTRALDLKTEYSLPVEKAVLNSEFEPTAESGGISQQVYQELDLTKPCPFFGKKPKTGDTVYLKHEMFGKTRSAISLYVHLVDPIRSLKPSESQELEIVWGVFLLPFSGLATVGCKQAIRSHRFSARFYR